MPGLTGDIGLGTQISSTSTVVTCATPTAQQQHSTPPQQLALQKYGCALPDNYNTLPFSLHAMLVQGLAAHTATQTHLSH